MRKLILFILFITILDYSAVYGATISVGPRTGGGGGASVPDHAAVTSNFLTGIVAGTWSSAQPATTDLSDWNTWLASGVFVSSSDTTYTQIGAPPFDGDTINAAGSISLDKLKVSVVDLTTDQTLGGVKTFTHPVVPTYITASIPGTFTVGESFGDSTLHALCMAFATDSATCLYGAALPVHVGASAIVSDVTDLVFNTNDFADDTSSGGVAKVKINWASSNNTTHTVETSRPMQRMTNLTTAAANAFVDIIHGTNFDYDVVSFTDGVTGDFYFKFNVPFNLATTPAWFLGIKHKAASGTGGNVYMAVDCYSYATAEVLDGSLVSIAAAAAVAVATSTTSTTTYFNCTANCDSTLPIAAGDTLICRIEAPRANAADTLDGIAWWVTDVIVYYNEKS